MSATRTFTITNNSTSPVEVASADISPSVPEFQATPSTTLPHTLMPSQFMTVDVQASSAAEGSAESNLIITHDGIDSPHISPLSATFVLGELTPPEVSGLVAWYDVSQLVGFLNGDPITTLPDLSGSGYPITQDTLSSRRPIYLTEQVNGLPLARFTRADQSFLYNANYKTTQEYIGVFKVRVPTFAGAYGAIAGETRNIFVGSMGTSNWAAWSSGFPGGANYYVDKSVISADAAPAFLEEFHLYDLAFMVALADKLVIGMGWFSISQCLDMDLCELAVYDNSMSSSDRSKLSNYFRNKWGTP